MKKLVLSLLAALAFFATPAFPQSITLPPSTVYGRLGISAGPGQAIPFATLTASLLGCPSPTSGAFPVYNATTGTFVCSTIGGTGSAATLNGGPLTINPTPNTTNQGINITQSPTGICPPVGAGPPTAPIFFGCAANSIFIAPTNVAGNGGVFQGLSVQMYQSGANNAPAVTGFFTNYMYGTPPTIPYDVVAIAALAQIDINVGGTGPALANSKGSVVTYNPYCIAGGTATFLVGINCAEFDIVARVGTSLYAKNGISIVQLQDSVVQASSVYDIAYSLSSANGAVGWKVGFGVNDLNGQGPLATNGVIFKTIGAATVADAFDVSSYNVTGYVLRSANVAIMGAGTAHLVAMVNTGYSITDGTVTGIFQPSSGLTNSVAFGASSNHPILLVTNNVAQAALGTAGNWIWAAYTTAGVIVNDTSGNITSTPTLSGLRGGTGLSTAAVGDIIYASATTPTWSRLADVAVGSVLVSGGVNTAPAWSASPTITTSITVPIHIGSTAAAGSAEVRATSGVGVGSELVKITGGSNGATRLANFTSALTTIDEKLLVSCGAASDCLRVTSSTSNTSVANYFSGPVFFYELTNVTAGNTLAIDFRGGSSVNSFAAIIAQNTTTTGGAVDGVLVFSTASAAAAASERMRISAAGGISIGATTDPGTGGLLVNGATITLVNLATDATHTDRTVCQDTTSKSLFFGSGAVGICLGTSGAQFKTAFAPMTAGVDEIMKIDFQTYRYRNGYGDDGQRVQYGPTAQSVEAAIPDLARHNAVGETINYDWGALMFIGLKAIQELKAANDNLRTEFEILKRKVAR